MRRLTRSSVISGSNEPLWQMNRLRNSFYLDCHLPELGDQCNMTLSGRGLTSPQQVLSFTSKNYSRPIDEILLVRYRENLISMVAFAREGVYEQLRKAPTKAVGKFAFVTNPHLEDHRKRLALTVDSTQAAEVARLKEFINCVRGLSPFNSTMEFLIDTLLNSPAEEVEASLALDINTEINAPYLSHPNVVLYYGGFQLFNPHRDVVIPRKCPAIFSAILDGDLERVKTMVHENPYHVLDCDPWGQEPVSLAREAHQTEIYRFLVLARGKVVAKNCPDQHNYQKSLEKIKPALSDKSIESSRKVNAQIQQLLSEPLPKRTALQQACLDGDFERVKFEVQQGASIESVDPLGFKPLMLAVAQNHLAIARWLIQQGACIKSYAHHHKFRGNLGFRLIYQTNTPEMMKLLLFYNVDREDALRRLMEFVQAGDFAMVETLLFYLRNINTKALGLSPFDFVINHSDDATQRRMVQLFSLYWDDTVPEGPYDTTVPDEVQKILSSHNSRQKKLEAARQQRPKIQEVVRVLDGRIMTRLSLQDNSEITLYTQQVSALTKTEIDDCFTLFNHTFALNENDSLINRINYFNEYFVNRHDRAYIDVCRHQGRIVSFLFYEFIEAKANSVGEFTIFHAQLGCSDPKYQGMGLANLAFRSALIAQQREEKLLIYSELIEPGNGINLFPRDFVGAPSNALPADVLPMVVAKTGEILNPDKSINTKLKLAADNPADKKFKSEKYRFFKENSVNTAAALAFFLETDTRKQFLKQMKDNLVTPLHLDAFSQLWPPSGVACKM